MIGHVVTLPAPFVPQVTLFAAMGGLSAALANRGVSVFHDGLRPLIPSLRSGELTRRAVSRTSLSLGLAFLWAFGLPMSLGFVIPLMFLIFIATDWIGVSLPAEHDVPWHRSSVSVRGSMMSLLLGSVWGVSVAVLLRLAAEAMKRLPIEMASRIQLVSSYSLGAFFLFAVLTVVYKYGIRQGLASMVVATVAWGIASAFTLGSPASWAFAAGLIYLVAATMSKARQAGDRSSAVPAEWLADDDEAALRDESASEDAIFRTNVRRIKRNLPLIALLNGLVGAGFNWGLLAADPISGALYAHGFTVAAALVVLGWAIAYVPMKYSTAVVTGCMATGTYLEPIVGMLMPNPLAAGIAAGALRIVEVYSLLWVVERLERFPSIREIGDVMRTAIFHVMEIGFLVGGSVAAVEFGGQWGAAAIIALWFINNRANSPIMPMSVGAVGALTVGVSANLLHLVGLSL